jgi:hypothetical protein
VAARMIAMQAVVETDKLPGGAEVLGMLRAQWCHKSRLLLQWTVALAAMKVNCLL